MRQFYIRNELDYINNILDPVRCEKTAFKLYTPKDDAIRNPNMMGTQNNIININ